jgi:hypothetical protein
MVGWWENKLLDEPPEGFSPLIESTFVTHRSHPASLNFLDIAGHSTFSSEVGSVSTIGLLDPQYELGQDQRANTFESIGSNSLPLDQPGEVSSAIRTIPTIGPNLPPLLKYGWLPILSSYMHVEIKVPIGRLFELA